jgi:hypothetical protein
MNETFVRTFKWKPQRDELKREVDAAEREAVTELGGPVVRSSKFLNGTRDFEMTWKRG